MPSLIAEGAQIENQVGTSHAAPQAIPQKACRPKQGNTIGHHQIRPRVRPPERGAFLESNQVVHVGGDDQASASPSQAIRQMRDGLCPRD